MHGSRHVGRSCVTWCVTICTIIDKECDQLWAAGAVCSNDATCSQVKCTFHNCITAMKLAGGCDATTDNSIFMIHVSCQTVMVHAHVHPHACTHMPHTSMGTPPPLMHAYAPTFTGTPTHARICPYIHRYPHACTHMPLHSQVPSCMHAYAPYILQVHSRMHAYAPYILQVHPPPRMHACINHYTIGYTIPHACISHYTHGYTLPHVCRE